MIINEFYLLSGLSTLFNFIQVLYIAQLTLIFFFCATIFGVLLLNKTRFVNLPEDVAWDFAMSICVLIFPALVVGAGIIAADMFLFPYLFEQAWNSTI